MTENRKELLRTIFNYHSLKQDDVNLKKIWSLDLEKYSTNEIEEAWNEWRMSKPNLGKKITSFDLIEIMNRKRKSKMIPHPIQFNDKLEKGTSLATDILIHNLEVMKNNMPDYRERMKECKSIKEKLTIGFTALGFDCSKIPGLVKSLSIFQEKENCNKNEQN